jgi:hypothetical protein
MTRCSACLSRRCLAGASLTWGDFGFIEFIADEATELVRVYHLVWTG